MTSAIDTATSTAGTTAVSTTSVDQMMDKEDFLMLLVAQMQNQDPLDPTDTTEYTNQLTQYSSLEQLMNLNDGVDAMMSMLSAGQNTSLNTLGKDVSYYGDTFNYGEGTVELGYHLDESAEEVTLLIQQNNTTCAEIRCSETDEGIHYVSWDGMTDDGSPAPGGEYTLTVLATDSSGAAIGAAPIVSTQVTAVNTNTTGGETLITGNGVLGYEEIITVFN